MPKEPWTDARGVPLLGHCDVYYSYELECSMLVLKYDIPSTQLWTKKHPLQKGQIVQGPTHLLGKRLTKSLKRKLEKI